MAVARTSYSTLAPGGTLPATVSAVAVAIAGALAFLGHGFGPQSMHMALHIAVMSVAAPLTSAMCHKHLPDWIGRYRTLWISAAAQLGLLWAWHTPFVHHAAMGSPALHMAAHVALYSSAFLFWSAIIRLHGARRWQAVAALLVTGKLSCLLSALLIFSPRALYHIPGHEGARLDDQQLAGLLMITACPLSYLVAAVVIAIQLINRLAQTSNPAPFKSG